MFAQKGCICYLHLYILKAFKSFNNWFEKRTGRFTKHKR